MGQNLTTLVESLHVAGKDKRQKLRFIFELDNYPKHATRAVVKLLRSEVPKLFSLRGLK